MAHGVAAALAEQLGPEAVLGPEADLSPWAQGARGERGRPAAVVRPVDTAAVARAVAYCVRHAIPFLTQSGNTGLVGGSIPDASGTQVVLSLDRLVRPLQIDGANRSARVGAGVRLARLNEALEPAGLWFPVDLGADPCLGGMVATNTGGARFLRYGDVRANTLGLTVVLPDAEGTVLRLDRALRKDNTGPDWKQLFIGTCGAFGIVTECVLDLAPLPRARATALLVPSDAAAVPALLQRLERCLGDDLSALELMSGNAMRHALAQTPALRDPFAGVQPPALALLVEIARTRAPTTQDPPLDAVLEELLAGLWEAGDSPLADAIFAPPEVLWPLRHALSPAVQQAGDLFAFDLAFERQRVLAFRESMRARLAADWPEIEVCDFGHVADGGLHFNLVCHDAERAREPGYEARLRAAVIAHAVEDFGGSFSGEHGIGRANQAAYDRYTAPTLKALADRFGTALGGVSAGGARFGEPPHGDDRGA